MKRLHADEGARMQLTRHATAVYQWVETQDMKLIAIMSWIGMHCFLEIISTMYLGGIWLPLTG